MMKLTENSYSLVYSITFTQKTINFSFVYKICFKVLKVSNLFLHIIFNDNMQTEVV